MTSSTFSSQSRSQSSALNHRRRNLHHHLHHHHHQRRSRINVLRSIDNYQSVDHNNNANNHNENETITIIDSIPIMDFDTNNFEQRSTNIDCVYLKSDRKELPISRSRYEKPTTARQERRILSKRSELANSTIAYDPAVQQEFIRLRDSVPSIAGHEEVSDLKIINEAISFICDLETKLVQKLNGTNMKLPDLLQQFLQRE